MTAQGKGAPDDTARILIVEDEVLFAKAVGKRLTKAGYAAEVVGKLSEARRKVEQNIPDLMLLDMRLPDGSGLDLLSELRERYGDDGVPVLVFSAYGELEDAVAAMKLKAADYLKKPVDLDELLLAVNKILAKSKLARELSYSRTREQHAAAEVVLLGESTATTRIREQVRHIAGLSAAPGTAPPTVLILGETGSGKDLVARLLHASSARKQRPFVHVDCASLPKDLIEAELFGHEKGAFTNAHSARTGLIEASEDGVLFLDEISELPIELQSKLLAVLERRSLRALGSNLERTVSAWFIAATNRDVEAMVAAGQLRADLYFRLNVITLQVPPLRDRGGDILLLARHFLNKTAMRYGMRQPVLTDGAKDALMRYGWPGNVRELKHLAERAALLSAGEAIAEDALMLPATLGQRRASAVGLEDMTLDEAERLLIEQALQRTGNNISEAARQLGVTRMAMRYRMKKHGLARADGR